MTSLSLAESEAIPMVPRAISFLALVASGAAFYACSSVPTTNTSTIRGTLASDSYPSVPTTVVAVDEAQHTTTAQISPAGAFELSLLKGHHYVLRVTLDSSDVPLISARADGTLDSGFTVRTGAAKFDMGAVHYVSNAATAGFRMMSSTVPATDGECENGVDAATGAVCVDGDEQASCEYGAQEEDDAEDGDNVECENGVDANTGAACVDDDAADVADAPVDAASPMAVPAKSIPNEIGGCNDGEEDDGEEDDD